MKNIYHQYSILRFILKIHMPWLVNHHFLFYIYFDDFTNIPWGPMAHAGISQLVTARTGPTAISLPATIGCTAFSHIFLLSLPKLGNVEHEQKKKTQQPTNDQTWYKWTRFGSSQNSEPRNHPKSNGLGQGSLNVPIEHHPTIRYMVYNGYFFRGCPIFPIYGTFTNPCRKSSYLGFPEKDLQGPRLSPYFHRFSTVFSTGLHRLCVLQLHACLTLSQAQQTSQACPAVI